MKKEIDMHKLAQAVLVVGVTLAAAAQTPQAARPGKADASAGRAQAVAVRHKASADSGAAQLPANAEKVRDGVWRAKDAAGKTWIYTHTPFGYNKMDEDTYQAAARASAPPALRLISASGGNATFERDTPFGKSRWTRPVAELSDEEKAAYGQRPDAAANDNK